MIKSQEKFNELLVYIVDYCAKSRPIEEIKLLKLLYFCDADFYFKNKNNTITGVTYIKNQYGPTPDKRVIDRATKYLKHNDIIRVETVTRSGKAPRRVYASALKSDFTYKNLTADEIDAARKTCDKYGNLPVNDLLLLSHQDPPYAGSEVRINFDLVKYRLGEDEMGELIRETDESYSGKISLEAAQRFLKYARTAT